MDGLLQALIINKEKPAGKVKMIVFINLKKQKVKGNQSLGL